MPRGATRGSEIEVTLIGNHLEDVQDILFYDLGITVKSIKPQDARTAKATLAIASHARLGEHRLRVRTATGVSHLRNFFVGALPVVDEKEPNNDSAASQKIELNTTIAGLMENEGVDYFSIDAKPGQRISIEVEGMRLANGFLDPQITIFNEAGDQLLFRDDGPLLLQDPAITFIASTAGRYTIQIRDSAYGGAGDTYYRMHIGTFPRPTAVYPAGGQVGQELSVQFLGDIAGAFSQTIKLPAEPLEEFEILSEQSGQLAPSANAIRVSPFPNILEAEPNDALDKATASTGELPLAFNGAIEKRGDIDFFKFTAKKGQQFHVNVFARRLRSPLDPVVSIERGDKTIATNDDTGGPDSYVRFNVPDDGEYAVTVRDHLRDGGADFVYRVEITPVAPKLAVSLPFFDQNNGQQERQAIVVPRGNRFATPMRVTRTDFGGVVTLSPTGLPDGITMQAGPIAEGVDTVPVVFEATSSASLSGRLADIIGSSTTADGRTVTGGFRQTVNLVPDGNNKPYYEIAVDKLAVAVADEAPFKINLVEPKVPIVQGGSMGLKIVAERKAGFDGPIRLQMVYNPPGVNAGGVEIPAGQNEAFVPLNAEDGAPPRKWSICVLGSADLPTGRVWVSTQLADLEIVPPMLAMKMDMTSVERGKPGQVVANVENKSPFEGKAKVKLVGLPPGVTASPEEVEITSADKTVTFSLTTTDKSPVGQHKSLLCIATVMKNGEPIIHNLARGGVLRIDAPAQGNTVAAKPGDAKPAAGLSRLEQLRQQAAAAANSK
jgi:hypothetical protein